MGIVIGILILSLMMVVHELGHFITGLRLGFTIEEFAIFMGPVLFSWKRKGIQYSIKLFPIGASVRFAGELSDDEDEVMDAGHFFKRPRWARASVIATGPALNLLSGLLAFFILFVSFGYTLPVIGEVLPGSQAQLAGVQPQERIVRLNDVRIRTTLDYSAELMMLAEDQPLQLLLEGPGRSRRTVTLQPAWKEAYRLGITVQGQADGHIMVDSVDPESNDGQPVLEAGDILLTADGVSTQDMAAFSQAVEASAGQPLQLTLIRGGAELQVTMRASRYRDPIDRGLVFVSSRQAGPALWQSVQWSWSIVKVTFKSIGAMFRGTIRPQDTLSGPVGVVSMISDVVKEPQPLLEKIYQLIWMFALISVTLGFMNLLPIPPLDGHHLILIGLEAIRGKRLSARLQNLIGLVGIAVIVALALFALLFDLLRLTGR